MADKDESNKVTEEKVVDKVEDKDPFAGFSTQVYDEEGSLVEEEDTGEEDAEDEEDAGEEDTGEDEEDAGEEDTGEDDEEDKTEDKTEDEAEKKDEDVPEKRTRRSFKDRANQLVKEKRVAERRADRAEAALEALQQHSDNPEKDLPKGKEDGKKEVSDKASKPDPEKYAYGELDPDYIADLTDFRVEQRLQARDAEQEEKRQRDAAERRAENITAQYDTVKEKGAKAYKDFDSVVVEGANDEKYKLNQTTAELLLESPVGHHVAYKLAKNPRLAEKLAQMSPIKGAVEFGRLEAQFLGKKKPPKPKTPNTEPPMQTRKGKAGAKETTHDTEDFAAFEKKVMAEARK